MIEKNHEFKPQPIHFDKHRTVRFVPNRIVDDLLEMIRDKLGYNMNDIAIQACNGKYTKEEQSQFAQLIGYSVSGWSTLSYVSDKEYDTVSKKVTKLIDKDKEATNE